MITKPSIYDILNQDGLLSVVIPNFQFRTEQQQMAKAIEDALVSNKNIIIEAGTGTGKTFSYLVPAFLSDQKIIISTGTKNLQSQLFDKDIPLIQHALNSPKKVVLLKGRANYLCIHRLEKSLNEGLFFSLQTVHELEKIRKWSAMTQTGDISEVVDIPEDSMIWSHVTSNHENCLGSKCPLFEDCYIQKARKNAQNADILVVNHHLFMADLILKEEGFNELLPGVTSVIFDEAHQLSQIATNFFGITISSNQIIELANDIKHEYLFNVKDIKELERISEKLRKATQNSRLEFGETSRKGTWAEISNNQSIMKSLENLILVLDSTIQQLGEVINRSKGLENCFERCINLLSQLKLFLKENSKDTINWFETFSKSFILRMTPLNISEIFKTYMKQYIGSWIFTSATISVSDNFDYFSENLGINDSETLQLSSPFNYEKQALLYIPTNLPNPNMSHYTQKVIEAIIPVLRASRGRAFLLFTSFKALHEAYKLLSKQMGYPMFVQGSMPKPILLNQFRATENAILLGTHSFWEGVDVRGDALSCVMIDKLPFVSPEEPILKARIEKLREQGKDPFNEYQLPHAVINLKQGIGRLIRDQNDTGILVICDPRIMLRTYGNVFIKTLPKMRLTRQIGDVENFFN